MESATSERATDHLSHNLRFWEGESESYQMRHAEQLPTRNPTWGVFSTPEAEVAVLGDVAGRDVIELGCGGAQFSIALARQGARCTGIDISPEQLAYAEKLLDTAAQEDGARPDVTVLEGNVEHVALPDASFDIAFSDYGASMFADPKLWVPEAARLLRPGGRLAFTTITPILELCWPADQAAASDRLVKDYFGLHQVHDRMIVFNLQYGEWVRLFRRCGLDIVDLVETRPREGMSSTTYRSANQVEWARRWPAEMIWVLERPAAA